MTYFEAAQEIEKLIGVSDLIINKNDKTVKALQMAHDLLVTEDNKNYHAIPVGPEELRAIDESVDPFADLYAK